MILDIEIWRELQHELKDLELTLGHEGLGLIGSLGLAIVAVGLCVDLLKGESHGLSLIGIGEL